MKTSEIRQRWLDFFAANGHTVVDSASLISPDPTTLFTIAGMVPFIPYMTGLQTPPENWNSKATSVQKCVRTADIEEVGKTTRHGTFFQMNGNFSFGDYFKEEAIEFAWVFLTGKVEDGCLGFPKEKLWATVWEEDSEAYNKWLEVGLDESRLQKRDKTENFWSTGGPGPAGPCSEIFYDRGEKYGDVGGPVHDDEVGTERYLEIWNLVFMQWQIDSVKSKYDFNIVGDLKRKNIDTGMGLERVAFLLQKKENIYEIDEVFPVIAEVEKLTGKKYKGTAKLGDADYQDEVKMRVLADHIRSSLMIINDGVTPSNEGRGYVLRRIMRRCISAMRLLGYEEKSMLRLFEVSKDAMKLSYSELESNWERIKNVVEAEETVFFRTLTSGLEFFNSAISSTSSDKLAKISGENAFKLHDTHGFPFELTLEMAAEKGVQVDEKVFRELMQEQKTRAREDAINKRGAAVDVSVYSELAKTVAKKLQADENKIIGNNAGLSEFLGYDVLEEKVRVVGILTEDGPVLAVKAKNDSEEPKLVEVILDRTPFYAQSGGQLADQGTIVLENGSELEVYDVQKPVPQLSVHKAKLISGEVTLDETGYAKVDENRRNAIAKAHTSTHIIHKSLHEIVGEGSTQAGSENSPNRVRFDFKAANGLSSETLAEIQQRANLKVRENSEVNDQIMSYKSAQNAGAMALFGEKYGDSVRVVSLGLTDSDKAGAEDSKNAWSVELCGGTHVKRTGEIGLITVLSEGSIGSGIRRVDALVGNSANEFHSKEHALINQVGGMLGTKDHDEIASRISTLLNKIKLQEKELEKVKSAKVQEEMRKAIAEIKQVGFFDVVVLKTKGVLADSLRDAVNNAKNQLSSKPAVIIAVSEAEDGKVSIIVAATPEAVEKGANAGSIIKSIFELIGGRGGGKADLAQGGAENAEKLDLALAEVYKKLG